VVHDLDHLPRSPASWPSRRRRRALAGIPENVRPSDRSSTAVAPAGWWGTLLMAQERGWCHAGPPCPARSSRRRLLENSLGQSAVLTPSRRARCSCSVGLPDSPAPAAGGCQVMSGRHLLGLLAIF
jgi:hypothetical protein